MMIFQHSVYKYISTLSANCNLTI